MKTFFLSAVIFMGSGAFAQTLPDSRTQGAAIKPSITNHSDSAIKVLYVKKSIYPEPAVYVNGTMVNRALMDFLDPKVIESVEVDKNDFQIGNVKYSGKIHVKTKSSYNPKLISLTQLKEKYTDLKKEPAIFMVDGEIITSDYDACVVDENVVLRIFVDQIENEKIDLKLIKLVTKKSPAKIMIRGTELAMSK